MRLNHELILQPGNWTVIFLSERSDNPPGYAEMDEATLHAVSRLPGFLGWEAARQSPVGIFVSYWKDKESIDRWRNDMLHARAKAQGRESWYDAYRSVVCRIEETHHFVRNGTDR